MDIEALSEMERLLKPGGKILITVPSIDGFRARSSLRNLGHDDPGGGEYHYRQGYSLDQLAEYLKTIPFLRLIRYRYSMFLVSELVMDLLKWLYSKKHGLKEHSDIMGIKRSWAFRFYQMIFPVFLAVFLLEDLLLAPFMKGHILIVVLEKKYKEGTRGQVLSNYF
jgi:SAM-dependent methyltransferase